MAFKFEKNGSSDSVAPKTVRQLFRKNRTEGQVGIEIECEGNTFQKENLPKPWTYHKDNSLRGADNAEYVLSSPIMFEGVAPVIGKLWGMFDAWGTKLDVSNRTSVHIHLNVQEFYLNRLASFFALYFSLEELLTEWCGEHRVGNLFCLRAKDAHAIVSSVKDFIVRDGRADFRDGMHYAGLNVSAMGKFGSVEIRSLRGVTDPQVILDWVKILERLYTLSGDLKDPREVTDMFSGGGPLNYLETVLGDECTAILLNGLTRDQQSIRNSLYEGIRLAQDICYCRDWAEYLKALDNRDPFGRISSKKPQSLSDYEQFLVQQGIPVTSSPYLPTSGYGLQANNFVTSAPISNPWLEPMSTTLEPEVEDEHEDEGDAYEPQYDPDIDDVDF